MPQSRPKENQNWLLNPRVPPPQPTLKLDNSVAKLENRHLQFQLTEELDTMENRKFRKKADHKHAMRSAKKCAQVVFAQASWPSARTEATSITTPSTKPTRRSTSSGSGSGSDNEESAEEETRRTETTRFPVTMGRLRPVTSIPSRPPQPGDTRPGSRRVGARSAVQGRLSQPRRRPNTVGGPQTSSRPSTRASNERSFQHLRDMAQMDINTRTKMTDARERALAVMAEKKREEDKQLQVRLKRFYTDLDSFIKRTKDAQEMSSFALRDHQQNAFLVDLSKLNVACGLDKDP